MLEAIKAVFEWITSLPEMVMSHEDGILVIAAICTIVVTVLGNGYFIRLLWYWWKKRRVNSILHLCSRISNNISMTLEQVDNAKFIETKYQLLNCAAKKICENQSDSHKSSQQHSDCKKNFWKRLVGWVRGFCRLVNRLRKTDYKVVFKHLVDRVRGFCHKKEKTEEEKFKYWLRAYPVCLVDQLYDSYCRNKYVKQIVIGKALRELRESKEIFKSDFEFMNEQKIKPLRDQKQHYTEDDEKFKALMKELNDEYCEFKKKVVKHLEETEVKVVEIHRDILLNL